MGMIFNAEESDRLFACNKFRLEQVGSLGHVSMTGQPTPKVEKHKHLGVLLNRSLTWHDHINMVDSACAQKVGMLQKLQRKLSSLALQGIYIGAVQPKMECACAVWCRGLIGKLVKLQETFCRQAGVSLPPLQRRFGYHTLLLFYKIRSEVAPTYLSSLLPPPVPSSDF